jgi:lipopolysaccharide export system protein LptA
MKLVPLTNNSVAKDSAAKDWATQDVVSQRLISGAPSRGGLRLAGAVICALLLAAVAPIAVSAQETGSSADSSGGGFGVSDGNDDEPLEISAENGIEWKRDARTYTARGNALAQQGNTSIAGDTLIAYLDENDEIARWEAIGNVTIRTAKSTSYGARAEYQEASRVMILTGGNLKVVTDKSTVTARDQIEYWRDRDAVVAKGAVVIVREDTTIHADEATGYFADSGATTDDGSESDLTQLDAQGHVRVDRKDQTAFSDKLAYNPNTEIAVLTGNVIINSKDNRYTGGRAELDMKNDISRLLPAGGQRVHTVIKTKKKDENAGGTAPVTQ